MRRTREIAQRGCHCWRSTPPVRDTDHGNVIAVVEFHEHAEAFKAELAEAEWRSWVSTAFITIVMTGVLFSVVAKGSRTIDEQRVALTERIAQLSELLQQNCVLRSRVERAARNATEDNERLMRRLGYDLHDGIAQLIGLSSAAPRPGARRRKRPRQSEEDPEGCCRMRSTIFGMSAEVCFSPEIQKFTLRDALNFMIRQHERRTGSTVTCHIADLPEEAPKFVKIALCRFVQEGLNNAFKHADGKGQRSVRHGTARQSQLRLRTKDRE